MANVVPRGGSCLKANDRLDPVSHHFLSDCGPQDFCSEASAIPSASVSSSSSTTTPTPAVSTDDHDDGADGDSLLRRAAAPPRPTICQPRQCRRDLHPFGYHANDTAPPLCPVGRFCPDEGNECKPLVAPGGSCQLGRDDQCEPPAGGKAICLSYTCRGADGQLGDPCEIENTAYVGYLDNGLPYSDVVTWSNCSADAYYCAPTTLTCTPLIAVGSPCSADVSCVSGSCAESGLCAPAPQLYVEVPPAVYVVVAFIIAVGLGALIVGLQLSHVSLSGKARDVREQIRDEQRQYSDAIRSRSEGSLLAPCAMAKDVAPGLHRRSPRATSH